MERRTETRYSQRLKVHFLGLDARRLKAAGLLGYSAVFGMALKRRTRCRSVPRTT